MQEGGLSDDEDQLQILGPLGKGIAREAPAITKDILTLMATGGLGAIPAARRVIGSRILGGLTRPLVQRAIRGESDPGLINFGSVTSQGEYVPPSDLVSITDESGADTGFSEYSDPGTAASYEGSFAKGGDVSVDDAEKMAPPGESLAYINDDEAALLKALGGAGQAVNETGIPSFFVKKVFKKAKNVVKKIVKSPIGKAAVAAGLGSYALGLGPFSAAGKFGGLKGAGFAQGLFPSIMDYSTPTRSFFTELGKGIGKIPGGGATAAILGASALAGMTAPKEEEQESISQRIADKTGLDIAAIRKEVQDAYAAGDISSLRTKYPFLIPTRAAAAEGGMMDLGGNEMDLRGGGFVPIGKKEKADDVPARLSKNEFVFTADAVRAAGGGSVDRGADLMYKTMKQLENKVA